jgi:pimeloyl-ACP methyl ester carboxylesterase
MRLAHEVFGEGHDGPALLIAHGLFGQGKNWGSLARRLARHRRVVTVDMRNHGDSPWSDAGGYRDMAGDLADTIAAVCGGRADVLGHSMGGKAAMVLALTEPDRVNRLIVADIAPVRYGHSHARFIAAMRGLYLPGIARRSDADAPLAEAIPEAPLRAFILQNLVVEDGRARWKPNLDTLARVIGELLDFPAGLPESFPGPALFLHGADSDYVAPETHGAIRARFTAARIEAIEGAGHWLHADRPEPFLAAVERFLRPAA